MNELKKKITDYVMSEEFTNTRWPVEDIDDTSDIVKLLYSITSDLQLEVDFTWCDNESDYWIEATVYIKNLLGEGKNYNVILDVDCPRYFDTMEELIETIYNQELHAQKIIQHFNS